MPSVDSTTSANWLKTTESTQFGTRELTVIKVLVTGGSNDMRYQDGATSSLSYTLPASLYSKAVRTLQNFVEVYAVYAPVATGFIAVIAADTANGADSGNTQGTGFGLAEAAINAALNASAATTISIPTIAIGTTL
jgi:hypothetical protein